MKTMASFVSFAALVFSLTACGDSPTETQPTDHERYAFTNFWYEDNEGRIDQKDIQTRRNDFRLSLFFDGKAKGIGAVVFDYGNYTYTLFYGAYTGTYEVAGDSVKIRLYDNANNEWWTNYLTYLRIHPDTIRGSVTIEDDSTSYRWGHDFVKVH